ncbi:MAG: metal-sensitive transcriptional regulator [Leptospiraceae bacterium]|nr:metal-sensitive transcriptional regulator [Leptospiraceae bacterium]MCP5498140.1 metal-sensitive transcriptional regulator [Leptospiraceae bacterium]
METEIDRSSLIHRLNRIQGQIEAIKKMIMDEEKRDCMNTLRLLKAANNAMKKFGEAYVNMHINECITDNTSVKSVEKDIKEVISSVFNF